MELMGSFWWSRDLAEECGRQKLKDILLNLRDNVKKLRDLLTNLRDSN